MFGASGHYPTPQTNMQENVWISSDPMQQNESVL